MVRVRSPAHPDGIAAWSHDEIDQVLAEVEDATTSAETLHSEFSARQKRWLAEADRVGFAKSVQQEGDAWARESEAASAIFHTAASSLPGVQVKIALMIQMCAAGMVDPAFPLPQLQSAFKDLSALAKM